MLSFLKFSRQAIRKQPIPGRPLLRRSTPKRSTPKRSMSIVAAFARITSITGTIILMLALVSTHAAARQVMLMPAVQDEIVLDKPYVLINQENKVYLKIGLTGFQSNKYTQRAPVNVALVIDRSGSMSGKKLRQAKQSALMAVDMLDQNDIISVITYGDQAKVIIPATKLTDKNYVKKRIRQISANGSTALYAGVRKGADEINKFLDKNHVNRVILLSDGRANVGPQSANELGRLGATLSRQGMSVSTIGLGLGYNEELMFNLADNSDGNHSFAENGNDLARIFQEEFDDVLTVTAQNVDIYVRLERGVRFVGSLGRSSKMTKGGVFAQLNQVYNQQEKYILLELDLPISEVETNRSIAQVQVSYNDILQQRRVSFNRDVYVNYTDSATEVANQSNKNVKAVAIEQKGALIAKEAVELRDKGKPSEAKAKLEQAAKLYNDAGDELSLPSLNSIGGNYAKEAESVENDRDWNRSRKALREQQYRTEKQYKRMK